MAFRAKYSSTCTICQQMIRPGEYKTWNRVSKGDMHLECWRKTEHYKQWREKQEHKQAAMDAWKRENPPKEIKQEDLSENIKDYPKELDKEISDELKEDRYVELKEENMTKESDNAALDVLGQAIWQRIEPKVSKLDGFEDKFKEFKQDVAETISAEIEKAKAEMPKPTIVTVENKDTGEVKDMGLQHKSFPTLIKMLSARDHQGHRQNIWLVGPAGTGKSLATQYAAAALGLRYASTGSIIESYKVLGHFSPGTGEYKATTFRDYWENGGVFCFDDFDGSDPNCVVELLAISNGVFAFPDAMVPRHRDFVLVLTANTWGLGGTSDYVGRLKQDAAFINRFIALHWEIDTELELATCPIQSWAKRVQKVRNRVKEKGIKVMITPRQSYQGAALLQAGFEQEEVEEIVLKQSMTNEQWQSVK